MKTLVRWGKFNLVGAMGMGVQLAALGLLNRLMRAHLLYASSAAVEITLLHNFAWHWHYTWHDRRGEASGLRTLVRFHLSNGVVSVLGNLALMQLLVYRTHLPLLIANVFAILCCSVANFCLGNSWAFATNPQKDADYGCEATATSLRSP
jgi:putative flippase GtrA